MHQNIKDDQGTQTEFFLYKSGTINKKSNRKFKLIIPANNVFGTGSHESTFLSIICIEYLIKKSITIQFVTLELVLEFYHSY